MKKRQRKKNRTNYHKSFWNCEFKLIDKVTGESKSLFSKDGPDELGNLIQQVSLEIKANPNYEIWFR